MDINKKALADMLAGGIKSTRQGSFVPEQVLKFFIEQCTGYCLTGKYLSTDSLAQWLKNEYDFQADDIAGLIKGMKEKARAEAGVEILMPGQPVPPGAIPPPKKEEKAAPADEEGGTEWNGEPQEEDGLDAEWKEEEDSDKLSLIDEDAAGGGMIVEEEEAREKEELLEMADEEPRDKPKEPESPLVSSIVEKAESGAMDDWTPPPIVPAESVRPHATSDNGHSETKPVPPAGPQPVARPDSAAGDARPSAPPAKPKGKQVTPPSLSLKEANAILTSLVTSGPEVEEAIANIARQKVLVGPDEAGAFLPTATPTPLMKVIREALCQQLIVEVDYAQYSGLRQVGGMILSEATVQSRDLMEKAGQALKNLEAAGQEAAKATHLDEEKKTIDISGRLKASIKSLNEVVSALSYIAPPAVPTPQAKYEDGVHMKKKESKAAHQEKKPPKKQKGPEGKSVKDLVKIAIAALFMIGVLVGTGYYVKHLFSSKIEIVNLNPKDFSEIMEIKEIRRDGESLVGIIDDAYWSGMTKEERTERANKLYNAIKSDKVLGMRLLTTQNKLLAQTYGGELKVF